MSKLTRRVYGWGIVGKSGKPWWDEGCVSQYRSSLDDVTNILNNHPQEDDLEIPYRVVRLFYETRKR